MILKLQQGGASLPPFVSYLPVTVTDLRNMPSTPTVPLGSTSKGLDLTDKDILGMLDKLNGLPSDMKLLTGQLLNFYVDMKYNPQTTVGVQSRYLSTLYLLKAANFNYEQYKDASKSISDKGGLNEVAINDRGLLYCMNKDRDFKLMSLSDLLKQKEYIPLTNSELLALRAEDINMAYKNDILKVVKNGTGMDKITKNIKDIISDLGTSEKTETGFINTDSKRILSGLNDFIQASKLAAGNNYDSTVDNLYKYKYITKSQADLASLAINYIYDTLSMADKTLLKVKSGENSDASAKRLISKMIASKVNNTANFDLEIDEPKAEKVSAESKKKGVNTFDLDPVSLLQAGYGEKETIHILTKEGISNSLDVPTVRMPITLKDGNVIGANSNLNDVSESAFAGYLKFDDASMGGNMIPTSGFSKIAIDGTALYTGYLPIDMEEYEFTGHIKPDLKMLGRYQLAQKKITEEQITDKDQINQIYKEAGLPVLFDGLGNVVTNYCKFGMINATALSSAFPEDTEFNDFVTETSDENEINNTVTSLQKDRSEKDRIDFDGKSFWDSLFGTDYDKVLKGTIFIPVNQDHFTATAGTGKYPNAAEAEKIEASQVANERAKAAKHAYINPGTL